MNLDALSALKAEAVEAFVGGSLSNADAAWSRLEPHYVRHEVEDGVFALTFNRLLIALESGERGEAARLMGLISEKFSEPVRALASFAIFSTISSVIACIASARLQCFCSRLSSGFRLVKPKSDSHFFSFTIVRPVA